MTKEIKKIATLLKPKFIIGKNDLNDNFISSIREYIKKNEIVKIKVLSVSKLQDISTIAKTLALKIDSEIIDIRGFTFVLYFKD